MSADSLPPCEKSRKAHSLLLQRLAGTQAAVAVALNTSESTISRVKSDHHTEMVFHMLTRCGLKVVDSGKICTDEAELRFLRRVYGLVCDHASHLLTEAES